MWISIFGIDHIAVSGPGLTDSELSMLAAAVSSMWLMDGAIWLAEAHKVMKRAETQVSLSPSPLFLAALFEGFMGSKVIALCVYCYNYFALCALLFVVELGICCCMTALLWDAAVSQFSVISVLAKMFFELSEWVNLSGTCSCRSGQRLQQTSPLPDCLSVAKPQSVY